MGGITYVEGKGYIGASTVEIFKSEMSEWQELEMSPIPVKNLGMSQKRNKYQACFARFNKKMIEKLQPLLN